MKVLIADSDPESIEDMSVALNLCIHELELMATTTGKDCVDTVKRKSVDVVILGTRLSDGDCFDIIPQIRDISNVPIMVTSHKKNGEELTMCLNLGANDYMVKPLQGIELIARIKKLVNTYKFRETNPDNPRINIP
jgi:DNA-binding response OmpR family regulator